MPLSPSTRARAALLAMLGLVEVEDQERGFALRLAQTAAAWPFAVAAQLLATLSVIVAMVIGTGRLSEAPLLVAAAVPLAGSATWLLLALPAAVRAPTAGRVRALTVAAAVIAGLLLTLLWAGAALPDRATAIACCVVLAGAMGVTAFVLQAVRAATLGFAAGLVVTLPLLAGAGVAAVAGLACFTCLAVAVLRLARLDDKAAAVSAAAESEGRLAAKMLAEFENQGTAGFGRPIARDASPTCRPRSPTCSPPPAARRSGAH